MALIVVADDDKLTRMMLRNALESGSHQVLEAANGRECLDHIKQSAPDLVMIDVFMPQMNGLDAVAEIRAVNSGLKIIGMSSGGSHGKSPYLTAIKKLGANNVITKPIKAAELLTMIGEILGQ